ncbi:MAG: rod shape-determining protein MreC [Candidatus Omnitrophica bacterium]|nr:rod shape-determining protein MreC [Candidatus Omnitrophota bacterium]
MFKLKDKRIAYAAICIVIVFAVFLSTPALRTPFLDSFRYPFSILAFIRREVSAFVFFHRNYVQKERLQKENDLLKTKLELADEAYRENARLKDILDLKQQSTFRMVAARVIARSPDNWSSAVMLDKGKSHGIRKGMAVVTFAGLAGKVTEASERSSKAMLINDPNLGVSAVIKRSRQEGLVCGTLGSTLVMRYLTKESDIQVSDTVITSGLTPVFPKGFMIGTVVAIGEEFSGLSRYALVKPAVDLSALEEVLIIVK